LRVVGEASPAVVEEQTYLLLGPAKAGSSTPPPAGDAPPDGELTEVVLPDDTLLFQYSALGFNSHRIHLDRTHAREVEGFEDLVVNGGLSTLLLTEFLRTRLGVVPAGIQVRHVMPLYCGRPVTLAARRNGAAWHLRALDEQHRTAVEMEVSVS
jgi:3-methylfumaryl-CoA hydratase